MKQIDSIAGKCYIATAPNGGVVTDEAGRTLATVEAGEQKAVWGTDGKLYLSDDDGKLVLATFNYALAVAGLLGGGDKLPAGYTRLEFLESTGTQYINTGVRLTEGFVLKCEFVPTRVVGHGCLFGARLAVNSVHCMRNNTSGTYGVPVISNGASYNMNIPFDLNESYSLELNDMDKKIVVNGEETSGLDFYSVPELDVYIFCENFPKEGNLANGVRAVFFDAIRCMRFDLANAGRRHKLVPALDPTGTPCMFDMVTRKPYYNSGTGDFTYPGKETQAATYSLRRPRQYAQMTERGIRRLYHVPRGYNGTPEEYAEQNGFKILVETPAPEEGYWAPVWHDREDCIELEWVETEPPAEELSTIE